MSKTPEELAYEWFWNNLSDAPAFVMFGNPLKHPPHPADAFIAGYKEAEKKHNRDNYNDHKLEEANEVIAKLKERIKVLTLLFSEVRETLNEAEDVQKFWKTNDLQFETHDKVGPWAGFFPKNK